MPENYSVIADVTPEQYDFLMRHATTCRMTADVDDVTVYTENNIPDFVQVAMLRILEGDGDDDTYGIIEEIDPDIYIAAARQWPAEVKAKILELSCPFIIREVEDGGESVFLGPDLEDANDLIKAYPPLRVMLLTDPSDVALWFR